MRKAFAEMSENGKRIDVHFSFSKDNYRAIKSVPGARFVGPEKGGPYWTIPANITVARTLREAYGSGLRLGDALKTWARKEVDQERNLHSLASSDTADLVRLPKVLPEFYEWLRPYQRADIKFMAETSLLNGNQPRLGKTTEVIGAVYEANLECGPHLVVAPKTSLNLIWRYEIERWTDGVVFTHSGSDKADFVDFRDCVLETDAAVWFVTNADMVRSGQIPDIEIWNSFTIDEFHKTGLSEIKNKFPKACNKIKSERRWPLSGTPMGGKPIKLWGALHFVDQDKFPSKWQWAEQWLEITEGYMKHKEIGGLKKGREQGFYKAHAPYMLRRLREEVLPQLPAKIEIHVPCTMTPKQKKQYDTFAADAEIRIEEEHLSATSILAEYTRLKQFANARCDLVEGKLLPTADSGKLEQLLARLLEAGIDPEDPDGDEQAIVTSQFKEFTNMFHAWLNLQGIVAEKITGDTNKKGERDAIIRRFQGTGSKAPRVLCLTTGAGGTAITLNRAATVHIMDETWNPDDQEQVADRAIDTVRNHQVTVFTYRSLKTIEEYIHQTTTDKALTNEDILDLRRQGFRATMQRQGVAA